MSRCVCIGVVFVFTSALAAAAQSSDSSPQNPPPKPAPSSATPSSSAPPPARAKDAKKPKKVWTNEEVGSLQGNVSVVGSATERPPSGSRASAQASQGGHSANWYRDQLAPLRSQIEDIDRQVRQLNSAKTGGRENIEMQLQVLAQKREKIQAKIDALDDEARRQGLAPGDLR